MKIGDKVICKNIRPYSTKDFYFGKTYVVTNIVGNDVEINNCWFLKDGDKDTFYTVPEYFENICETRKRKLNKIMSYENKR